MSRTTYIDLARSTCLCEHGMPGYLLAVTIDPDGNTDLLLLDQTLLDCGEVHNRYDLTTPQAPHEQTGRLPAQWRHRVALTQPRCGRPTKTGRPCRTLVTQPGDACGWHRPQGGAR